MRWLVLADIHGNMPALEAILQSPQAHTCCRIISLGDQVNYGPQSREVLEHLTRLDAVMLLGNHEDRLLHLDSPDLSGYNWRLLHWTARQLEGVRLDYPPELRLGPALFTHGTPGNLYNHLKNDHEIPSYMDALPAGVTHLFSGHAHRTWYVQHNGRLAVNPGSAGCGKSTQGGQATFAVYDDISGEVQLHSAPYSVDEVARSFLLTGAVEAAPMMCRIVLQTMYTGSESSVTHLMKHIISTGAPYGLTLGDEAAWTLADQTYPWAQPLSTPDYWKIMKETLL